MIYLLSQIGISLALAAIFGGTIGWLLQRVRSTKKVRQLQQSLIRQQQQVNQANTDVAMLTEDFNDLKQRTSEEIESLQADNQKLPLLHQNLEKSQLLVRQMMQKHEAQVRELTIENANMSDRLKLVKDREQTLSKLQAELEIERRSHAKNQANVSANKNSDLAADTQAELNLSSDDAQTTDTNAVVTNTADSDSSSTDLSDVNTAITSANDEPNSDTSIHKKDRSSGSSSWASKSIKSAEVLAAQDELTQLHEQLSLESTNTESSAGSILATDHASATNNGTEQGASSNDVKPAVKSDTSVKQKAAAKPVEIKPIFEPVDQHDDLKQIFGIGPVTEKTLNKLGLTSYSQLAELKRHDIEKIAEALQIFPGRIERDNWVGSARQQLEAVLEDL